MDFPQVFAETARYALADFAQDPPAYHPCADLAALARAVQEMRAGRPMEARDTALLVGATAEERRRALVAVIRHPDGSVAHDLRLMFQHESFEAVRQALAAAGKPRRVA